MLCKWYRVKIKQGEIIMEIIKFWIPEETPDNSAEVAAAEMEIAAFEATHPDWERVNSPRWAGKYGVEFWPPEK